MTVVQCDSHTVIRRASVTVIRCAAKPPWSNGHTVKLSHHHTVTLSNGHSVKQTMIIQPTNIEQSGPGIDLSNQSEGISVHMSDPVEDFEYARNTVSLTFDLSVYEHVRLTFKALEYGDEPHAPPPSPFGNDVDFDGVAISANGIDWYEIQDLRSLRSDRFTAYDIDLDAAVASLGISYKGAFIVRFCQYDNNPAPMDGFSIQEIELNGNLIPPILHLTMDDNAASPTVMDSAAGQHNLTFIDPVGNPNTSAHSTSGAVGTALQFDGVDDCIEASSHGSQFAQMGTGDFSVALWAKTSADGCLVSRYYGANTSGEYMLNISSGRFTVIIANGIYDERIYAYTESNTVNDGEWHHLAVSMDRDGEMTIYLDGEAAGAKDITSYAAINMQAVQEFYIGRRDRATSPGFFNGAVDDLRVYDRTLLMAEVQALWQ